MVSGLTMKVMRKLCAFVIFVLFIVSVSTVANAQTIDTTTEDNVLHFISGVMGIDTSKYELTAHSYGSSYPSTFGGSVKQEIMALTLNSSDGSSIQADVTFNNGYMGTGFFYLFGPVGEEQQYNVSTLEKAKNVLLRYQSFYPQLGISSDELPSALMMLSSVKELSTSSITNGNIKMQITCSEPDKETGLEYNTRIAFYYTDKEVDSTWKCLSLGFCCSDGVTKFIFADTWGLFSAYSSSLPCLSETDAKTIAWDAAMNYEVELLNTDDMSTVFVTPEWPATPSVESSLVMSPGQLYNDSGLIGLSMGSTPRDGLMFYPLWEFLFYLDKPIGDIQGIQVGVWGDTKEIAYCGTYGFYGTPALSPSPDPITPQPGATSPFNALLVTLAAALGLTIAAIIGITLKKRKRNRQTF